MKEKWFEKLLNYSDLRE